MQVTDRVHVCGWEGGGSDGLLVCKEFKVSLFTWARVCVTGSWLRPPTLPSTCIDCNYCSGLWSMPTSHTAATPFTYINTTRTCMKDKFLNEVCSSIYPLLNNIISNLSFTHITNMDISKNKDSWVKIHGGCKYILINYLRKHLMHVAIRWVGVPHCFWNLTFFSFSYIIIEI